MKIRKKRKKDTINRSNIHKSILILVMLICMILAMITYWIYAYHHKYGKFYFDDINIVSYKISDYLEVKGNIVHLKNIEEEIIQNFAISQQNIITNNNVINVDIAKYLDKNILSAMINYTIYEDNINYEEVLTINIDLKNNKLLTNEELLEMVNSNYKVIAEDIFKENIKLPSDSNKMVTDRITDKELTAEQFNKESDKYIIRIREKLPEIMKLYIKDNKLYYIVELSEIDKLCYYTNEDRLVNITRKIGKI